VQVLHAVWPNLPLVGQRDLSWRADAYAEEPVRVEVEKSLAELASARETVEVELVGSDTVDIGELLEDRENEEIVACTAVEDRLVVMNV
jgi:hypothetical protein